MYTTEFCHFYEKHITEKEQNGNQKNREIKN